MSVKTNQCFVPYMYNRRSWVKTQTLLQITILTRSFGNCHFVYHLVLNYHLQNVTRSPFCIPKVVRIGAYKGANYSPKVTILVNLGTLLNKVFGPQESIFNHLVLVCSIFKRKIRKFTSFLGGGGIVTSLAYIYTMEQKDSCQRMVYGQ